MKDSIRTRVRARQVRSRRRMRTAAMVMAGASVMVGLMFGGIEPVAAHGVRVNGCTAVPDSGFGFNFHNECDAHDRCYRIQPFGSGYTGRRHCDMVFRHQMLEECASQNPHGLRRRTCEAVATTYYYGVRVLGGPFWNRQAPTPIA